MLIAPLGILLTAIVMLSVVPQSGRGAVDPVVAAAGDTVCVVGTGRKSHYPFTLVEPNSQVRNDATFGVLALTLHAHGHSGQFTPAAGGRFNDKGSGSCHGGD